MPGGEGASAEIFLKSGKKIQDFKTLENNKSTRLVLLSVDKTLALA